jgi:hypothetical protein
VCSSQFIIKKAKQKEEKERQKSVKLKKRIGRKERKRAEREGREWDATDDDSYASSAQDALAGPEELEAAMAYGGGQDDSDEQEFEPVPRKKSSRGGKGGGSTDDRKVSKVTMKPTSKDLATNRKGGEAGSAGGAMMLGVFEEMLGAEDEEAVDITAVTGRQLTGRKGQRYDDDGDESSGSDESYEGDHGPPAYIEEIEVEPVEPARGRNRKTDRTRGKPLKKVAV